MEAGCKRSVASILLRVVLFLAALGPGLAEAQDEWLILPSVPDGAPSWMPAVTAQLADALERQGASVIRPGEARVRFEASHSTPIAEITDAEVAEFRALGASAVQQFALMNPDGALEALRRAEALYLRAQDEFNQAIPADVLDVCLFAVRAKVLKGATEEAGVAQARFCLQRIPGVEPTLFKHKSIANMVEAARTRLRTESNAALTVTSSPSGCLVRINGTILGRTKASLDQFAAGDYRVRVECDGLRSDRVHSVRLEHGKATELHVDAFFDAHMGSDPELHLTGFAAPSREEDAAALSLASELRARHVLLVRVAERGEVSLVHLASDAPRSHVPLPEPSRLGAPWPGDALTAALGIVMRDVRAADDKAAPTTVPDPTALRRKRSSIATATLLGAGGASMGASLVLTLAGKHERGFLGAGVAGTLLLLGGMATLGLERSDASVAWPIAIGLVGAGAAVGASLELRNVADPCIDCSRAVGHRSRGLLFTMAAVPALAYPVAYGIGRLLGTRESPSVTPSYDHGTRSAHLTFARRF
jgi:hypothetical protein